MYPSVKSNALSEAETVALVGKEAVEKVKAESCDFTGRLIDDVYEVTEMSASIDLTDDTTLTILYLIPNDQLKENEDLGELSYDNYTFTVE
jgi:hypothetical protein